MSPPVNPPPNQTPPQKRPELDDAPPLLGSWRNVYLLVFGAFVLFLALSSLLTWVYS